MMDINTVSAGGGTIAEVDRFGVLKVGPESAGAVPGPACYGRGGVKPTITDCNLVLGYLSENNFLGGKMRLETEKARRAVETHVARPLGLDLVEAAEGVVRIINVKMEEAIKAISTMRGYDLRDFMLLPFGGAGPIHAARIAQELGMAGLVVPLYPGVFSAIGLLMSDVKHDHIRSKMTPLAKTTVEQINDVFGRMERDARAELEEEGFATERIRIDRSLDLRYAGQGYELTIACGPLSSPDDLKALRTTFDTQHKSMFGHMAPGEPVEIVSYRLQATGLVPPVPLQKFAPAGGKLEDAVRERRRVRFDGADLDTPVYQRERLDVDATFKGPAVIDQFDCTTVVYPGQTVRVDEFKNLIVTGVSD
jgi:N-methylhydantoinase A